MQAYKVNVQTDQKYWKIVLFLVDKRNCDVMEQILDIGFGLKASKYTL